MLAFSTLSPFYSIWKHSYQVVQLASRVALLASVKPFWESPREHTQLVLSPVKPAMKISHRKWGKLLRNDVSVWEDGDSV